MHCNHCKQDLAADRFYLGNKSKCKECVKESVRKHRQENLERVRAYDRMRGSMPHRVAARAEYKKTAAFAESHAAAAKRWSANHPSRRAANIAVGNAVRCGRLIPWPICSIPSCDQKPEAHHPDYDRPLDVVWLCSTHHKEAHKLARSL